MSTIHEMEDKRLYKELERQLDVCKNERELAVFLKNNLILLRPLNVWANNYFKVFPEFKLGTKYVVDYLIVSADSGSWHTVFVEAQSHKDKMFTKIGNMTKELNEGERQITQWSNWVSNHNNEFRESLAAKIDGPARCSNADDHVKASTEIRDYRTVINKYYKILIGRKAFLDKEKNQLRTRCNCDYEIVTYDRILDFLKPNDD